jgi:hypothetical protein
MTQSSSRTWCEHLQAKLMKALDAVWETIASSDDPALIRKARDKARACGEMAANARKIAAMTPPPKPVRAGAVFAAASASTSALATRDLDAEDAPTRGLDRLRGGGRGRL